MKRLLIIATIAGWAVFGAACANKGPFRSVVRQDACFPSDGADPVPSGDGTVRTAPSVDCRHVLYSTGFVEFEGNGSLVDPAQAKKALALIRERKKSAPDRKVITVVYVHGWKNNASRAAPGAKAKDVEKFQTALQELGYRARAAANALPFGDPHRRTPVPVVGIYIGWPGKSLMGPSWFTFLSYWSRRGAANSVGDGDGLGPLLGELIAETRKDSPNARVILVGHSFGARVLEHAIENRHVALYDERATGPVDPLVDLVLYVNSANDARLSVSRVIALQKKPITLRHPDYDAKTCEAVEAKQRAARTAAGTSELPTPRAVAQCRDYPLLVAITSRGDDATKRLQPIANIFSDGSPKLAPLNLPTTFVDPTPSEGDFSRRAAAHMPFLQSHGVHEIACPVIPSPRDAAPEPGSLAATIEEAVRKAVDAKLGVEKTPEEEAAERKAALRAQAQAREEAKLRREQALQPQCAVNDLLCRFAFRTRGPRATCFQVTERTGVPARPAEPEIPQGVGRPGRAAAAAEPARPPFNKTAFWIMDVDPVVMADHGDIWNLSFVEMLGQLMAPRNFFEPGAAPLKLQAVPPAAPAQP